MNKHLCEISVNSSSFLWLFCENCIRPSVRSFVRSSILPAHLLSASLFHSTKFSRDSDECEGDGMGSQLKIKRRPWPWGEMTERNFRIHFRSHYQFRHICVPMPMDGARQSIHLEHIRPPSRWHRSEKAYEISFHHNYYYYFRIYVVSSQRHRAAENIYLYENERARLTIPIHSYVITIN